MSAVHFLNTLSKNAPNADIRAHISSPDFAFPKPSTEDPNVMPEANPLLYELVVRDSAGAIIRQHSMSCPHKYGERYTTLLMLQKLQEKILIEGKEDGI